MAPTPKIAVVGSGAAAFGVLTALADDGADYDITLIDIGHSVATGPVDRQMSRDEAVEYYDAIYRTLRQSNPHKFPPPKTHFGEQIPRQPVGERLRIFKSESIGGLTNYWGATLLPFTRREMTRWPIEAEALHPYYERISHEIGLAAQPDGLDRYFPDRFETRPPIRPTAVLAKLDEVVNRHGGIDERSRQETHRPTDHGQGIEIVSGVNRCAVETRSERSNSCTYCGECMLGCYRDAIYSTRHALDRLLASGAIGRFVKGRVVGIDAGARSLSIESSAGTTTEGGFDRIFLCAGCPATTEIVMRSVGLTEGPVMRDNAVHVFPILHLGRRPKGTPRNEDYLSLCNLILGCLPASDDEHFAQVQVYPNFDYLWRYNLPPALWPMIRPFMPPLRNRVVWGRLYLHSDHSQAYGCYLRNDRFELEPAKDGSHGTANAHSRRTGIAR